MPQVPNVLTVATAEEVLGALLATGINRDAANILCAESAFETASWKGMHNWNVGNTTTAHPDRDPWMDQGLHGMQFKAFATLQDGAADMVHWLSKRGAIVYAESGNVDGYVTVLESGCYMGCVGRTDVTGHTVSQDDYDALANTIKQKVQKLALLTPQSPSSLKGMLGLALVVGGAFVAVKTGMVKL